MITKQEIAAAKEAEKRARQRAEAVSRDPIVRAAVSAANKKTRELARETLRQKA